MTYKMLMEISGDLRLQKFILPINKAFCYFVSFILARRLNERCNFNTHAIHSLTDRHCPCPNFSQVLLSSFLVHRTWASVSILAGPMVAILSRILLSQFRENFPTFIFEFL